MNITFNVDQALDKLVELVRAHGQQAVNTAVVVERVNSIGTLLQGAALLLVTGLANKIV